MGHLVRLKMNAFAFIIKIIETERKVVKSKIFDNFGKDMLITRGFAGIFEGLQEDMALTLIAGFVIHILY